jgi:uncharacterized protein involved in exopolysaccharide biosynthesis
VEPYRERTEDFIRRWRSRYEGDRVFGVLVIMVVLAAVGVTLAGLQQTPTYEASALVWVNWQQGDQQMELANQAGSGEMIKTLPPKGAELQQAIMQPLVYAID